MRSRRISIRLDEPIARRVRAEAKAGGRAESDIVRDALAANIQTINESLSVLELAKRLGFHFKTGKHLPRDLSTNPKHMEGFGE